MYKFGPLTSNMSDTGHVDDATGRRAFNLIQQQDGEEEVTQMINTQLGLKAILRQTLGAHHHTWWRTRQTGDWC